MRLLVGPEGDNNSWVLFVLVDNLVRHAYKVCKDFLQVSNSLTMMNANRRRHEDVYVRRGSWRTVLYLAESLLESWGN